MIYIYQLFAQSYQKEGRKVALFALSENLFREEIMGKYEPSPQMQAIYTLRGEVNRLQKELDIITEERNELRRKVVTLRESVALRDNLVTEQQKQLDESARDAEALNAAVKVLARILTTMDKG